MSQHDYNIANAGGAAVRSDMNNALVAIQSQNSGSTAPTSTKPFMPWYDTTTGALKMRNAADTGWISMAEAAGGLSLRNKIINGNMGIAQRGTAAVTVANEYGPCDRWQNAILGNSVSVTQGSFVSGDTLYDTGGAQYYTQVVVTSVAGVGNYSFLMQKIEDVRLLAGQTVTVSFWAKAASGTPSIGININQLFGTGGTPSANVAGAGQSQALTTTWEKYSKTFTIGSLNGKTVGTTANTSSTRLTFWLDAGSNFNTESGSIGQSSKTVSIAQVQLEVGPVATPFEQRPIGMELALCQRYALVIPTTTFFGSGTLRTGGTASYGFTATPVQMRTAPSATPNTGAVYVGDTSTNYTSLGISGNSVNGIYTAPTFATSAGTVGQAFFIYSASGAIVLSSEL